MSARILARDVGVRLGGRTILESVSATLHSGDFVAIVGPNGSGKTTFLRALSGQVDATGAIDIEGRPLGALSLGQRARLIAWLPQDMRRPAWPMPVRDIVALGLTPFDPFARGDDPAVAQKLRDFDLAALADRPADSLSGGERMRALLARVLVGSQPCILLDEPLTSLDPAHQVQTLRLLARRAAAGDLVVAILHELDLALHFATRVLAFDTGRLVADATPADLPLQDLERLFGVSFVSAGTESGRVVAPRSWPAP